MVSLNALLMIQFIMYSSLCRYYEKLLIPLLSCTIAYMFLSYSDMLGEPEPPESIPNGFLFFFMDAKLNLE